MSCGDLVSIVVPAYNSDKYIKEAIESVMAQTYQNWELLLINDGSTDSTGKIIDEFAKNDKRIKAIHINNQGVSFARNIGLDNVKGEWVAFLDSDDILPKHAIEKLIDASDGQDLVIGNYCEFPSGNKKKMLIDSKNINIIESIKKFLFVGVAWGMIYKKECLTERFEEDINFGEDTLFFYGQLRNCSNISTIKDVVYQYRRGNECSLSYQKQNIKARYVEKLCSTLMDLLKSDPEFCNAYVAHVAIDYITAIIMIETISKEKRYEIVNEIITSPPFKEISLRGLKLKEKERRKFLLLKTGDIALFEKELESEPKQNQ